MLRRRRQRIHHTKKRPQGPLSRQNTTGEASALDAILEHLAGSECGHALGRDLDLFAGLGVQTLTSRSLTGLEGTEAQD